MSMQRYPNNPVERRKRAVRQYSRNAAIWGIGGTGAAIVSGLIIGSTLAMLVFICAVAGASYNAWRVNKIINHRDLN
ncbi:MULTISPECIES: hypothetical protein [Corynebacterium]|uniref:hypothetical protein n=1 Tax=Corynebacterium TaxID=1716 RepID=UPI00124D0AC3|nr:MULTISPECIES: hypothetical protein [Corynebacterium]